MALLVYLIKYILRLKINSLPLRLFREIYLVYTILSYIRLRDGEFKPTTSLLVDFTSSLILLLDHTNRPSSIVTLSAQFLQISLVVTNYSLLYPCLFYMFLQSFQIFGPCIQFPLHKPLKKCSDKNFNWHLSHFVRYITLEL